MLDVVSWYRSLYPQVRQLGSIFSKPDVLENNRFTTHANIKTVPRNCCMNFW